MGLLAKLRGERVDIIEWLDESRDTLVWRFPRYQNEIKNGAKLVVREGQFAVFVNEGQIADHFYPGTHTLCTENLPVLSTLKSWKYGFHSPFKAEVYFMATRPFTEGKWGTQHPVLIPDPTFGLITVSAFGSYVLQVSNPELLLTRQLSTHPDLRTDRVADYIRSQITESLADSMAAAGATVLDCAVRQREIGRQLARRLNPALTQLGLRLGQLVVESISLPPEVAAAVRRQAALRVLARRVDDLTALNAAEAITLAADNPGGLASTSAGMAIGAHLAKQLSDARPDAATPPPLPPATAWFVVVDGAPEGPMTRRELDSRRTAGDVTAETPVWREGLDAWMPLGHVPELSDAKAVPPPPEAGD